VTTDNKKVLAVGAHPDDVESFCAGTLFLLRELGYQIHIATMTLGDCGSRELSAQEIRHIRRKEAEAACELLGASYRYLGFNDLSIYNDDISNRRTASALREVDPLVVMTHPPNDYMSDHEVTSLLVRNACFYAPAPNYDTLSFTPVARSSAIPYLYYFEPLDGIDIFGEKVRPQFYVDISQSIEGRLEMLGRHQSQREWLKSHHGMDDYVEEARCRCRDAGERASRVCGRTVAYAEGFRQHLGHAYPRENFLERVLHGRVLRETTSHSQYR
jgi:N-acetylglucosamine malate deacetylase 1